MDNYPAAIVDDLMALDGFFEITASDIENNFYILETKQPAVDKIKIHLVITEAGADLSIESIPEFASWNFRSCESHNDIIDFVNNIIFNNVEIVCRKILFVSYINVNIGMENIKIVRFFNTFKNGKLVFKSWNSTIRHN